MPTLTCKLVLASNSPRRKDLLRQLDLSFEVRTIDNIDESYPPTLPVGEVALFLSEKKARAYMPTMKPDELIITADTIVACNEKVMGKPADREDAVRMLTLLSGRTHKVITGVCLASSQGVTKFSATTQVTFTHLTPQMIAYYVDRYRPYDKAGAYGIQEWIGHVGITHIEGSYFNVVGLPVARLYTALRDIGAVVMDDTDADHDADNCQNQAVDERFADIQMLRYRLDGFNELTLKQKCYIYYLSEATLWGRDIVFDQHCRHNIALRQTLEAIYSHHDPTDDPDQYKALVDYLKQVWFASGIHHHYGSEKFVPAFTPGFFRRCLSELPDEALPLPEGTARHDFETELTDIVFNAQLLAKRVNLTDGVDIVRTSACNFYQGVSQEEAEGFYQGKKQAYLASGRGDNMPSWGLNSTLVKDGEMLREDIWKIGGKYSAALQKIVDNLLRARAYVENEQQQQLIDLLVDYYRTGDLATFDNYSISWAQATAGKVDFINGFIEVYGDPLGIKATWEGIVHYVDAEATRRTELISSNAQWFEDHAPVHPQYRKAKVTGIRATVVRAAMLGGEEYPATAIGINLPNADWIRARYGSKSVTISNVIEAYNEATLGNGFYEEFIPDDGVRQMVLEYSNICDALHTDLHECVGHGSGQLMPHTDPNALKAYGSTIEEARADLFGLYFIADDKMLSLRLLPDGNAYRAQYYTYLLNGLMTQLVRIKPGQQIEEAHMRNRALIARWVLKNGEGVVSMPKVDGKTRLVIHDYDKLRRLFATLLMQIQQIKSEGDYPAARHLVETYAISVAPSLHEEVLQRYAKLNIAPYKGFINPRLTPIYDASTGSLSDIRVDYDESYAEQMMRYSTQYAAL